MSGKCGKGSLSTWLPIGQPIRSVLIWSHCEQFVFIGSNSGRSVAPTDHADQEMTDQRFTLYRWEPWKRRYVVHADNLLDWECDAIKMRYKAHMIDPKLYYFTPKVANEADTKENP